MLSYIIKLLNMQQNQNRYTNSYQQIPHDGPQTRPLSYAQPNAATPPNINQQMIEPIQRTDQQFYNSLARFKPLLYNGKGSPLFLVNKGWYLSLGCIMVINALFILTLLVFLKSAGEGMKPMSADNIRKYKVVNIVLMSVMNISYFLTQFMNPGIRNLSTISQEQYEKNGKYFCSSCNGYRTETMQHCRDCEVCIQDLDHHCGFFSKCIGGLQKYVFYAFLSFVLLGFLSLIVSMTASL